MRRSEPVVIGFVAFLAIVMAVGVEAMLSAFDLVDSILLFGGWPLIAVTGSALALLAMAKPRSEPPSPWSSATGWSRPWMASPTRPT